MSGRRVDRGGAKTNSVDIAEATKGFTNARVLSGIDLENIERKNENIG